MNGKLENLAKLCKMPIRDSFINLLFRGSS